MSGPERVSSFGITRYVGRHGGEPVITGTHLLTRVIADAFMKGLLIEDISRVFGAMTHEIEAAIRFEACLRVGAPWAIALVAVRLDRRRTKKRATRKGARRR